MALGVALTGLLVPQAVQATFSLAVTKRAEATVPSVLDRQVRTLCDGRSAAGDAQRVRLDSRRLSGLSSGVYIITLKALWDTLVRLASRGSAERGLCSGEEPCAAATTKIPPSAT